MRRFSRNVPAPPQLPQPLSPQSEPKKSHDKTVIIVTVILVAIIVFASLVWINSLFNRVQTPQLTGPNIKVLAVKSNEYTIGLDIRATVTGTLQNIGDTNAQVLAKVYTKWDNQVQDYQMRSTSVAAHGTVDVSADLDVPESIRDGNLWYDNYYYGVEIISVSKM